MTSSSSNNNTKQSQKQKKEKQEQKENKKQNVDEKKLEGEGNTSGDHGISEEVVEIEDENEPTKEVTEEKNEDNESKDDAELKRTEEESEKPTKYNFDFTVSYGSYGSSTIPQPNQIGSPIFVGMQKNLRMIGTVSKNKRYIFFIFYQSILQFVLFVLLEFFSCMVS